jgi:hypothetical protein
MKSKQVYFPSGASGTMHLMTSGFEIVIVAP